METNREDLKQYTVPGEGGTMTCQPARLTWLKEEFRHMTLHGGWSVNDRRLLAEDTRYCRWPGQSTDGKSTRTRTRASRRSPSRVRATCGCGRPTTSSTSR